MSEEQLRAQFEEDAAPYGYDLSPAACGCCTYQAEGTNDRWMGFNACAEIKDAENSYLIGCKDAEIDILKTCLKQCENTDLELKAQVEKMREALRTLLNDTQHKEHNCGDMEYCSVLLARTALESTTQPFLTDHDRKIEIKVLEKSIYCTVDQIRAMIEERKNKS
jgi:hypothetical protein